MTTTTVPETTTFPVTTTSSATTTRNGAATTTTAATTSTVAPTTMTTAGSATTATTTTSTSTSVRATSAPTSTTTTTPPTEGSERTPNWSGYAVTTGPYGEITGTFTVPFLTTNAICSEENGVWAGIDGFNAASLPNDSDLIQAGISEGMTNPATGECNPGTFYVWPWWEILPAPETLITTWGNGAVATVNAGDQVTVTVLQVSLTMWSINLVDDTTGGSFTTEQAYSAPESSGEWVMEAVSNTGLCQGTCQFPPYCVMSGGECSAPVPFSNLGATGDQSTLWDITMVQNGLAVSTPSPFSNNSFTVAYTGTDATPAGPSAGARSPLKSDGPPAKLASPIYSKSPDAFSSRHLGAEKEGPVRTR